LLPVSFYLFNVADHGWLSRIQVFIIPNPGSRSASATLTFYFYFFIFREEAAKLLGEGSISQYMEKVIQRIEAEDVR
jgi:hypothetical protein